MIPKRFRMKEQAVEAVAISRSVDQEERVHGH
jgi:hypothetical protein